MSGEQVASTLDAARSAFERGHFDAARELYESALERHRSADALDGLGQCLWFLGEIDAGIAFREQAYAAFRRAGATARAAEIALWLVVEHETSLGNEAAAAGWYARADRLLEQAPTCPAHAQLEVRRGQLCADSDEAAEHFQLAVDIGRRLGDLDSEVRGLNQLGYLKVSLGDVDDGMRLLDETMAAATAGELADPWAIGATCCSVLFACEQIADLKRAGEWCEVVLDLTERRAYVPLSALCRSVYAGVLVAKGQWERAESELLGALQTYRGLGRPLAAYPLARLADLRQRQGRIEEAEKLIAGWEGHPEMGPIAVALLIDRGQTELARARLEHQLARVGVLSPFAARLLPLRVRLQLELGEPEAAESTAADLDRLARQLGHEHVLAMSDLVRGVVGRVRGTATAVADLETAVERYQRLGMPYDEGRAHLELAESVAPDEPELAVDEARRALKLFEPLGALRDADRAAELLRSLGASGRAGRRLPGGLSGREREVLALIEHGLSNTEIAARLFIAPKTASHHVSNVLAKLGVRTRAEAAAFAARERAAGSAVE